MFFTTKGDSPKVLFLQLFCHEAKQVLASSGLCTDSRFEVFSNYIIPQHILPAVVKVQAELQGISEGVVESTISAGCLGESLLHPTYVRGKDSLAVFGNPGFLSVSVCCDKLTLPLLWVWLPPLGTFILLTY